MNPFSSSRAISLLIVALETPNNFASVTLPTGDATSAYCSIIAANIWIWRSVIVLLYALSGTHAIRVPDSAFDTMSNTPYIMLMYTIAS